MTRRVRPVSVEADDAIELAEMLEFLANWIGADQTSVERSLIRFAGSPVYDAAGLRADLRRFAFLLGGCDPRLVLDDEEGKR